MVGDAHFLTLFLRHTRSYIFAMCVVHIVNYQSLPTRRDCGTHAIQKVHDLKHFCSTHERKKCTVFYCKIPYVAKMLQTRF